MKPLNSKWNYVLVGVNAMIAGIGAVSHSVFLFVLGIIFIIWNWFTAEHVRRIEDEEIRKSATETKE